jgi:hypothetical protein
MIGTPQIAGMVFFVMEPVGLQFEKIDHVWVKLSLSPSK